MAKLSSDEEFAVHWSVHITLSLIALFVLVVDKFLRVHASRKMLKKKKAGKAAVKPVTGSPSLVRNDTKDLHGVIIDQIAAITLSVSHLLDHGMETYRLRSGFAEELFSKHQEQLDMWLEKLKMLEGSHAGRSL